VLCRPAGHGCDLTKEQRDEHIRRYAELLEVRRELSANLSNNSAPVGRPKAIATEVAEQTGLSSRTVRRALNPMPAPSTPPQPAPKPALVEPRNKVTTARGKIAVPYYKRKVGKALVTRFFCP